MLTADTKDYQVTDEGGFKYYETGSGPVILMLHGLFGALSNFKGLVNHFAKTHTVSIPILPLFDLPKDDTTVVGLLKYVEDFISYKAYKDMVLVGNSLGGHIALMYALQAQHNVKGIVLTGSSGLFEDSLGNSYPRKSDYDYVKEKTEATFFNRSIASKELVDEVYDIVNNREKALCVLYLAKSALRHNLKDRIAEIKVPVLLIWGAGDIITPPFVGEEFDKLLPNSELHILNECGHAPMMELPEKFNALVETFLTNTVQK